jgi:uncharacterized membrane protein (DUF106 family)
MVEWLKVKRKVRETNEQNNEVQEFNKKKFKIVSYMGWILTLNSQIFIYLIKNNYQNENKRSIHKILLVVPYPVYWRTFRISSFQNWW